jgi:hypothetical protein
MPEGQPIVIYVHDPGTEREDVVISPGEASPDNLGQGNGLGAPTDNQTIAGVGRAKDTYYAGSNFFMRAPTERYILLG